MKCDGAGDYLLFRNFISFLKTSQKYKQHKIYLLANTSTKNLATKLDSKIIDGFFWYSDSFFLKWDLVTLLFGLQRLRPETIVYPNYSRKYTTDWLLNEIKATHKITVTGDNINESTDLMMRSDKFYNLFLQVDTSPLHEFERNKQIMEALTAESCAFTQPVIEKESLHIIKNDSIIIFTGASSPDKKWPAKSFNMLCRSICADYKTNLIVVSGKDEVDETAIITNGIAIESISVKTNLNLTELCELIAGAKMLISGDTVAVHIAAALAIPAVCIAKGDLYGRFVPYPPKISNIVTTILPPGYLAKKENIDQYSGFDIADVTVGDVYKTVKNILNGVRLA